MTLKCLGSSSRGNCYLLTAQDGETLMIEAGIDFKEVKKALNFNLMGVVGCVVSHEHRDHCKYLPDVLSAGIKGYALKEVYQSFQILRGRAFANEIKPMHHYKIGGFTIFTLPVNHDVPCLGFIVEHPEMGLLLFITDTMMLEYRVEGLNHIMIEANYSDRILQDNIDNGLSPASMRARLMSTHMEITTTLDALRATNLSSVNEVILLHLSGTNSNEGQFIDSARRVAGKPVYVAAPGLGIELSKSPY